MTVDPRDAVRLAVMTRPANTLQGLPACMGGEGGLRSSEKLNINAVSG